MKRLYDTDPRWHRDRVQIGAKFTWIQAQIADLNHKIKRYGDLYQQLRSSRQRVTLEDKTEKDPVQTESTKEVVKEHSEATATSSVNSMLPINKNIQNSQKNGLIKHLAKSADGPEDRSEKGCCSARTLVTTRFPKHRYIKQNMRPEPLLVKSEKCQCPDLSTPFLCAKCHKATLEGHRKSSGKQLAASLDDSYHSQLSFDFGKLPILVKSVLFCKNWCFLRNASNPLDNLHECQQPILFSRIPGKVRSLDKYLGVTWQHDGNM